MNTLHRREFIKSLGLSAASLPFLIGLPSLGLASPARPRQRLVVMFSPNGTIPTAFWPDETGREFKLKDIMAPLTPFKDRMLVLNGLSSHADHGGLLRALGPHAGTARRLRLVHGEPERAAALAEGLRAAGFADVAIPDRGDTAPV